MKRIWMLFVVAVALAVASDRTFSQSVLGFACVAVPGSSNCADGTTIGLRGNMTTSGSYATVAGHNAPGDGGGGDFVKLGAAPSFCNTYLSGISGNGIVGQSTITGLSGTSFNITTLEVGELVTGNGTDGTGGTVKVQPGTEIASNDGSNTIGLTLPLTGTSTTTVSMTVTFAGDNDGTLIVDSEPSGGTNPGPQCWQKANYRGDPREWGAWGDGNLQPPLIPHDDTTALQNWLGAYGNVSNSLAPGTAPANFGPWIASIPGSYLVSSPLSCPVNATIQGTSNLTNGKTPRFEIVAAPPSVSMPLVPFSGLLPGSVTQAVLSAQAFCRLSGVGITVNQPPLSIIGSVNGTTTITFVTGTILTEIFAGNAVTGTSIQANTAVVSVNSGCSPIPCIVISNATTGPSMSEPLTFWGPDAVDVLGTRVTIDGFSSMTGGRYNVDCGDNGQVDGIAVKDTQLKDSTSDNFHTAGNPAMCANERLIGDIITGAGGEGVVFGGDDITVADGVIEQSTGIGLDLTGADKVSVTGNFFDDNGKGQGGGAAIEIKGTSTASICGNHLTGNGEYSTPYPAQVYFAGTNDGIVFCGNSYGAENSTGDVTLRPSYAYDADPSTVLTNSHLYESPPPQVVGDAYSPYSPNAKSILSQLQLPQVVPNQLSGFTLANTAVATEVQMVSGVAVDSSNSVLIQNAGPCTVNLAGSDGEGGLDMGNRLPSTTYFYFAIAQADGTIPGGVQSCIASLSQAPTFRMTSGGNYALTTKTFSIAGNTVLYNVQSVAGIRPGDEIDSSAGLVNAGTYVSSVGTLTVNTLGTTPTACGTMYPCDQLITISSSTDFLQMQIGMSLSDSATYTPACIGGATAQSVIPANDTIIALNPAGTPANTIALSKATNTISSSSADCINVSAGHTVTMTGNANITSQDGTEALKIYTGVYRMVGALYTDSSRNVVVFSQDGDTFYLTVPGKDIFVVNLGNSDTPYTLASLPNGVPVEWLGRCVSSAKVILYNWLQAPGQPVAFPTTPGYDVTSLSQTAERYRVWTNSAQQIHARANGPGTAFECMTDGWVLHRNQ